MFASFFPDNGRDAVLGSSQRLESPPLADAAEAFGDPKA